MRFALRDGSGALPRSAFSVSVFPHWFFDILILRANAGRNKAASPPPRLGALEGSLRADRQDGAGGGLAADLSPPNSRLLVSIRGCKQFLKRRLGGKAANCPATARSTPQTSFSSVVGCAAPRVVARLPGSIPNLPYLGAIRAWPGSGPVISMFGREEAIKYAALGAELSG